jgi:hypothetical protein
MTVKNFWQTMRRQSALWPYYGVVALLVYMPFHIFLSQWLSALTGGLEVWKVAKDGFIALLGLFTICLVWRRGKGTRLFWWVALAGALYGVLHLAVWAANPSISTESAALGTIYNARLPALLIIGYGAALLTPHKFVFSSITKLLVGISTVVVVAGVAQYFLPSDFLTHFGYSLERGARPAFFIDDHPELPRIMSTLREPNALGAYLLVPITLLTYRLVRSPASRKRQSVLAGILAIHLLALALTQSRSAWIAALVVMTLIGGWLYRRLVVGLIRRASGRRSLPRRSIGRSRTCRRHSVPSRAGRA